MLTITVPAVDDVFDESTETFLHFPEQTLQLEHSLLSISKWESKWHKSFLSSQTMTQDEMIDYIRCMTINQNVQPNAYYRLSVENQKEIRAYIDDPMTATVINQADQKKNRKVITSEVIYGWMIALGIPFECQKWHLNRLLTLIEVCDLQNRPSKKMSKKDIYNRNRMLNAQRRAKRGSSG